jgi:hypothetical protein
VFLSDSSLYRKNPERTRIQQIEETIKAFVKAKLLKIVPHSFIVSMAPIQALIHVGLRRHVHPNEKSSLMCERDERIPNTLMCELGPEMLT